MKFSKNRLTFISDSSSLILLAKAYLLNLLCDYSDLYITLDIKNEIEYESDDSYMIKNLINSDKIIVRKIFDKHQIPSLDAGENSAIMLFKTILVDYLIIDDKKAAMYCKRNSIPFINALLIPLYLYKMSAIDNEMVISKTQLLSKIGRYGPWIKEYVFNMLHEDLKKI